MSGRFVQKKLVSLFLISLTAVVLSSCLLGRFAWYNFSDIKDYKIFPSRSLPRAGKPFCFIDAQRTDKVGRLNLKKIDSIAKSNSSVALLIIRNDTLYFENYYKGYDQSSTVPSFSMAKSYTSALVGAAIADGFIKSVNDPVTDYLPELKDKLGFAKVTIRHLLLMTSGVKANENYYNPFGQAAKLYYGRRLRVYLKHLQTDYAPGTKFAYRSINTQILGFVVERATGKTLTTYLDEKIWSHLDTEFDANWSIDKKKNGMEKTFCCLNAKARDFAKFGRLYLNEGNWNGIQLLPAQWVNESVTRSNTDGAISYYKYQWWLSKKGFYADGLHGQFIYVNPAKKVIIVRLGKNQGHIAWPKLFDQIADAL